VGLLERNQQKAPYHYLSHKQREEAIARRNQDPGLERGKKTVHSAVRASEGKTKNARRKIPRTKKKGGAGSDKRRGS